MLAASAKIRSSPSPTDAEDFAVMQRLECQRRQDNQLPSFGFRGGYGNPHLAINSRIEADYEYCELRFVPAALHYLQNVCVYISYHTISYHTIPYHTIPYHTISYHIISYHIIPYHIISYHIISYHILSYPIISYHIISYHIIYIYI